MEGVQAADALLRLEELVPDGGWRNVAAGEVGLTLLDFSTSRLLDFDPSHAGPRQEPRQILAHSHRSRAGTAAAMRGGEGLVQVEVHDVDADVAGSRNT